MFNQTIPPQCGIFYFASVAQQELKMKNFDPNEEIKIRDAVNADIPRILSMVQALAIFHDDVPQITSEAIERDAFGEIPWIYIMVLEIKGVVVGYSALCPLAHLEMGVRGIDMHHLFIEEEFRGLGIGKKLINASIQKARELSCEFMKVGTHPENTGAQSVYLACGFVKRRSSNSRFHISLV